MVAVQLGSVRAGGETRLEGKAVTPNPIPKSEAWSDAHSGANILEQGRDMTGGVHRTDLSDFLG